MPDQVSDDQPLVSSHQPLVLPHERVDDLQFRGLRIIQDPSAFCFGMDAVLLSDFARIRPGDRVGDLGTGTGILALLLAGREPRSTFEAFEIQPAMADMARRSVLLNGLQTRIVVHCGDMSQASQRLGHGGLSLVVANPPYGRRGETLLNPAMEKRLARHEVGGTIEAFCRSAGQLLKYGGRFCVVFPAGRMLELADAMRNARLEPKRMRLVFSKADKPPHLVLMEGIKGARPMVHMLPPLIIYEVDGQPTKELERIYHCGPYRQAPGPSAQGSK